MATITESAARCIRRDKRTESASPRATKSRPCASKRGIAVLEGAARVLATDVEAFTQDVAQEELVLSHNAFTRLLEWLDDGTDSSGQSYLEMRRRLVAYFDGRNRPFADDLADETLTRVSRTLEMSGAIAVRPPARYCYVVAKFVLLEDIRRGRRSVQIDERRACVSSQRAWLRGGARDDDASLQEQRLACLDRCLETLKPEHRDLAIEYYRDAKRARIERRQEMAKRLGITMNALGIRASRIRTALEACIADCTDGE